MIEQVEDVNGADQRALGQHTYFFNQVWLRYKWGQAEEYGCNDEDAPWNSVKPLHGIFTL